MREPPGAIVAGVNTRANDAVRVDGVDRHEPLSDGDCVVPSAAQFERYGVGLRDRTRERVQAAGLLIQRQGLGHPSDPEQRVSVEMVGAGRSRIERDRMLELSLGVIESEVLRECVAESGVRLGQRAVEGQRSGGVGRTRVEARRAPTSPS